MSAWEDRLSAETPRGLDGRRDEVPYARWTPPEALGDAWRYSRDKIFLGYRAGQVFYNALLVDIADEDEIGKVSGNGWAFGSFGGISAW